MTTLAQQRLAALDRWFDRNSRGGFTPNGGEMIVGRYASIVPWAFDTPPIPDADPQAIIFYAPIEQCGDVRFADYDPAEPIDSQRDIAERLEHCLWLWGDVKLPPCIVASLARGEAPRDAVARAGVAGADLAALPVLCVSLAALADGPRSRLAARLPFIPNADAVEPDMPCDPVFEFENRYDRW